MCLKKRKWQEDHPPPDYRIETYDFWVPDQASQIETKDIESEEYARLYEEQSAIIIHLIMDAFH